MINRGLLCWLSAKESARTAWVRSVGWEDPLEKEMATCSMILAWRIPWIEEPGGLSFIGFQRVDVTKAMCTHAPN